MEDLSTYLNDHLAGSVGALELLDRLIDTYQGKPLERFFVDLRSEIDADQETLKELIASLGEEESTVRKARDGTARPSRGETVGSRARGFYVRLLRLRRPQ